MSPRTVDLVRRVRLAAERFFATHGDDAALMFQALLTAEDRRGARHKGIDFYSLVRAMVYLPVRGRIEGISTVEQQLVRTIFPRAKGRVLLMTKLGELYLSYRLAKSLEKERIWAAYLQLAYYGAHLSSYADVRRRFNPPGLPLQVSAASAIAACLKYPIPGRDRRSWRSRHRLRSQYIAARLGEPTWSGRPQAGRQLKIVPMSDIRPLRH